MYTEFLHLPAAHRIERNRNRRAAAHRHRTGQLLRPLVRDRFKDAAVALLVHKRHRRRLHAANGERDHLQFRERAAHAVDVHHRHTEACRRRDGQHRVDAARLNGHEGVNLLPKELRDHVKELLILRAADGLFRQYRRCAHHRNRDDQRIIRDFLRLQQRHRAALLHCADGHELADIGIAAAARAEQGRAGRNIFNFRDTDFPHNNTPSLRFRGHGQCHAPKSNYLFFAGNAFARMT